MKPEFQESARAEEQKRVAQLQNDDRRKSLLQEIRKDTENYLRAAEDLRNRQKESHQQEVNRTHGKLIEQQGYTRDFLPPGVTRNLKARAEELVNHEQSQARDGLRAGYEKSVRDRINYAVQADRLDRRIEQYVVDRNAWVAQHTNIVEQIGRAQTDAEKVRYGEALATLDRSWARTIERYMDGNTRDRGLQPEFGRFAHDVGRGR